VLARIKNMELKTAYIMCEGMQIIQGIDMCIECDTQGILLYLDVEKFPEC
jgi:hypothetical protein